MLVGCLKFAEEMGSGVGSCNCSESDQVIEAIRSIGASHVKSLSLGNTYEVDRLDPVILIGSHFELNHDIRRLPNLKDLYTCGVRVVNLGILSVHTLHFTAL